MKHRLPSPISIDLSVLALPIELPYQGDATIYDSSGATGSIANGAVQPGDAIYDDATATGSNTGTTMPADVIYD